MRPWSEDFSGCGLEEILQWQAENRAWSRELRRKTNSLVNSRLAKEISQDDYLASRKLAHEEAAECQRRATILDTQITWRMVGSGSRGN
jgi:hypothetical protein